MIRPIIRLFENKKFDMFEMSIDFADDISYHNDGNLNFRSLALIELKARYFKNSLDFVINKACLYENLILFTIWRKWLKVINKPFGTEKDIVNMIKFLRNRKEYNEMVFLYDGWDIKNYKMFSDRLCAYLHTHKCSVDCFYIFFN